MENLGHVQVRIGNSNTPKWVCLFLIKLEECYNYSVIMRFYLVAYSPYKRRFYVILIGCCIVYVENDISLITHYYGFKRVWYVVSGGVLHDVNETWEQHESEIFYVLKFPYKFFLLLHF